MAAINLKNDCSDARNDLYTKDNATLAVWSTSTTSSWHQRLMTEWWHELYARQLLGRLQVELALECHLWTKVNDCWLKKKWNLTLRELLDFLCFFVDSCASWAWLLECFSSFSWIVVLILTLLVNNHGRQWCHHWKLGHLANNAAQPNSSKVSCTCDLCRPPSTSGPKGEEWGMDVLKESWLMMRGRKSPPGPRRINGGKDWPLIPLQGPPFAIKMTSSEWISLEEERGKKPAKLNLQVPLFLTLSAAWQCIEGRGRPQATRMWTSQFCWWMTMIEGYWYCSPPLKTGHVATYRLLWVMKIPLAFVIRPEEVREAGCGWPHSLL